MGDSTTAGDVKDLNAIPYDAPFSFELPDPKWVAAQTRKGAKWTTVSVGPADLTDKWVIITGSNNGIGREAALQMAEWGANLILACREPPPHETHPDKVADECKERAKKAGKVLQVEWWEIDMADLSSVESFAKRWLDTGRPLVSALDRVYRTVFNWEQDILCNNAGMGSSPGGAAENFYTKDGFEIIHQVCLPIIQY